MVRAFLVAMVLSAFGLAMVGCHAQESGSGTVSGNETSSMSLGR
jgi:hypothetical protein